MGLLAPAYGNGSNRNGPPGRAGTPARGSGTAPASPPGRAGVSGSRGSGGVGAPGSGGAGAYSPRLTPDDAPLVAPSIETIFRDATTPIIDRYRTGSQGQNDYAASLEAERARLAALYGSDMIDAYFSKSDAQRGLMFQPLLDANSRSGLQIAYDANMANLGLDRQSNGIDQSGVLRDIGYYNDVYNLDARGALAGMQDAGMAQKSREQQMREQLAIGGGGWVQGLRADKEQSDYQYDTTIRGINLDLERSGLNRDQQVAQANDRLAQLKIQAQRYNVSESQLSRQLQNELDRLGLSGMMTVGQLLDQSKRADVSIASFQDQIIKQAIANLAGRGGGGSGSGGKNVAQTRDPDRWNPQRVR